MSDTDANLIPTDDGEPSPGEDQAVDCLSGVDLHSFTAEPATIQPFSAGATLRWRVTVPQGCRVALRLNGAPASASGTQHVDPVATTTYTLTAHSLGLRTTLASATVRVDTRACLTGTVPESLIRTELQQVVRALDQGESRVSLRSDPRIEVEDDGIHVALRFKVAIDNFADPDLDVDFTIGVRIRNGAAEPFYRRFAVDVDWPWWVTAVTAGASKIVEEVVEDKIEDGLKPQILAEVKAQIDALVDRLPGELRLNALRFSANQISITACPPGDQTPFLVLPTRGG
jgi:hypothetical protein